MILPKSVLQQIIKYVEKDKSIEQCGYLAGKEGLVHEYYELTNVDQSIEHFTMDPKEQFATMKQARDKGLELLAVFHSHPETPARPSQEDIRLALDASISYVIISLAAEKPDIKSFKINQGEVVSEDLQITD